MAYAYPPTRIPQVAGIQVYGLGRLSSIYIAMWLVPGELWCLVGSRHLP